MVGGTSAHFDSRVSSTSHTVAKSMVSIIFIMMPVLNSGTTTSCMVVIKMYRLSSKPFSLQVAYEFSQMATSYFDSYSEEEEEEFGSGGYMDSEDEDEGGEEGSSWDEPKFSVKVVEVGGGADLVGGWGPGGLLEACAVTLREEALRAAFIVTGGKSSRSTGGAVGKCHKGIVQMETSNRARVDHGQDCGKLLHPRRQHGCTLATIGGSEAVIVAGGLGGGDSPVMQVEYLIVGGSNPWARDTFIQPWRVLGELNNARFGFPSVGEVLGQLVVAGGKASSTSKFNFAGEETLDIDPDLDVAENSIEVI